MRGRVIVEEPAQFQKWLASNPTYAQTAARVAGDPAAGQALYAVCTACHGAAGEGNQVLNAPKLAGQEAWYLRRQIQNFRHGLRGGSAGDATGQQMSAMAATLADDAAVDNVLAYIGTLPDTPAPHTVTGDTANGRRLYGTCSGCHGREGQGIWSVSAPRQSGMSDWYMLAQLQKFRHDLRGADRRDGFGEQMAAMAKVFVNVDVAKDVVAYINTLPPPAHPRALASASGNEVTLGRR
jgi:cytochrome c oxidase subunit 2